MIGAQSPVRRRIAAIDVGSNSVRLIVAETDGSGGYRVIDDEKDIARLGQGLESTGALRPERMARAGETIARMKRIADGYGVEHLSVIATAAVREATNRHELLDLVQRTAGVPVEVISAEEEARLAHLSVNTAFDLRGVSCAVVDIGGGSTEIVSSVDGVIGAVHTLPLGAVRLMERFGDGSDARAYRSMHKHVEARLREALPRPTPAPSLLYGSGGVFTSLASMSMHRAGGEGAELLPFSVRGHELQRDEVRHELDRLRRMPTAQRAQVPGLSADRVDIIVTGLTLVDCVMKRLGVNRLRVHDRGIRDGLLLSMARRLEPDPLEAAGPVDRLQAARRFARMCRYEHRHSEQVSRLAVRLFDDLAGAGSSLCEDERDWRSPVNRELLEASAVLHDVGYLINYSKHHKHSQHLIVHSDMPGYTSRQLDIVAQVARYHRRSRPKQSHASFARLDRRDQELVRRLSAILRIADGMDRTHMQSVRDASVLLVDGAAVFRVSGVDEDGVDIWGAERKAGLFEEVFGLTARFEAAPRRAGAGEGEVCGG